jgi:hypothetical protein
MLRSELRSRSHGGSRHATSHWVSGNAVLRYDIWSQRIRITHVKPGPILLQSKKTPPLSHSATNVAWKSRQTLPLRTAVVKYFPIQELHPRSKVSVCTVSIASR